MTEPLIPLKNSHSNENDETILNSKKRPWIRFVLVCFVIAIAIFTGLILLFKNVSSTDSTEMKPLNFAEVVMTDLIQEESFNGTLGSQEIDPVITHIGGTITEIASLGETINQGDVLFSINNQNVVALYGDFPFFRDIAIGDEVVTVSNQLSGMITWVAEPGTVVSQGDVLFRINDQPVIVMYGELPAYQDIALNVNGDESVIIPSQLDGTITWVSEPGTVINQGDIIYRIDDKPVVALYGEQPAYRDIYNTLWIASEAQLTAAQSLVTIKADILAQAEDAYAPHRNKPDSDLNKAITGVAWSAAYHDYNVALSNLQYWNGQSRQKLAGDDVYQLEEAFLALGMDVNGNLVADGIYTNETTQAICAFQAAVGLEIDGVINLGEVVFLPGPTQVLEVLAAPGDTSGGDVVRVAISDLSNRMDVFQLEEGLIALGFDAEGALVADGVYTPETTKAIFALQAEYGLKQDGVINIGEIVFLPGAGQVLDIITDSGNQTAEGVVSISTGGPATGTDVFQLEEALVTLGFGEDGALVADGIYTRETNRAILAFQAASGLEQDGIINFGEVVFLPGEVRITDQQAIKGSNIGEGSAILGLSSSEKVVQLDLPADKQGSLNPGDNVNVELPDFTLLPAKVTFVSQSATATANGSAIFEVLIELDDSTMVEGLDEAPVDVIFVSDSIENVMAVPVSALIALLEGGYAVEMDIGNGTTKLVAVEVGFFSTNNMIEIISDELQPGDMVVVP